MHKKVFLTLFVLFSIPSMAMENHPKKIRYEDHGETDLIERSAKLQNTLKNISLGAYESELKLHLSGQPARHSALKPAGSFANYPRAGG